MIVRKFFLTVLAVLIALWISAFAYFIFETQHMKPESELAPTDAIIVLTGGPKRIEEGLSLLAHKKSGKLLISGVHPDVKLDEIKRLWKGNTPLPECCIELGQQARTTLQNAQETKDWVRAHDIHSIRLVTANYHMPRAMIEIRAVLPDVQIVRHPVEDPDLDIKRRWQFILSEFHKAAFRKLTLALDLPDHEWLGAQNGY